MRTFYYKDRPCGRDDEDKLLTSIRIYAPGGTYTPFLKAVCQVKGGVCPTPRNIVSPLTIE
jgi:hypothetical protein